MDSHDTHDVQDEPQTPMWLPALGIVLFLVAGIWWAMRPVPQAPPPPATSASATPPPAVSVAPAPPRGH